MAEDQTPQEIIEEANDLARLFYGQFGCIVRKGYRFDKAHHPMEKNMWSLAILAYDHLRATDLVDVLIYVEESRHD